MINDSELTQTLLNPLILPRDWWSCRILHIGSSWDPSSPPRSPQVHPFSCPGRRPSPQQASRGTQLQSPRQRQWVLHQWTTWGLRQKTLRWAVVHPKVHRVHLSISWWNLSDRALSCSGERTYLFSIDLRERSRCQPTCHIKMGVRNPYKCFFRVSLTFYTLTLILKFWINYFNI